VSGFLNKKKFVSRELSWLEFNARVLDEAGDIGNPLLERLKFIAIFSSNLDEFFMIRVAGLRQLLGSKTLQTDCSGLKPAEQIKAIKKRLKGLIERKYRYLLQEILPELEEKGIQLVETEQLSSEQRIFLKEYFLNQVFPVLTPFAVDPSHPFPILNSGAIEIAVSLSRDNSGKALHAFVEVPPLLPRFIQINSSHKNKRQYVLLEDLIMEHIQFLFSNCKIDEIIPFRITRDMDFSLEEEGVADLMQYMKKELLHRKSREPIRLELPKGCRGKLAEWLMEQFQLDDDLKYNVPAPLNPAAFFEFIGKVNRPDLMNQLWPPLPVPEFSNDRGSMFSVIDREECVMAAAPFQSFDPVVKLLNEAADDPDVLAVKQTLYRVSGDSPVIKALQRAAENGKQVTVILELKARFDEDNNINWAVKLEESGAHVIYGIAGFKIHCKALLIVKRAKDMRIKRYVHLATGNYNDKTAKLYTDIGMFMCDPEICLEVSSLFNVITGYSSPLNNWNRIAVAPFSLREKFIELIDREARVSTRNNPGRIIAKMNSLVDPEIIARLYRAAAAGVKIDLIVRGICCLKPVAGNINVISIVDRYLEHSRIFYFRNCGEEEYFLSSADWMPRNLDHRIEIMFPVEKESVRKIIRQMLEIQLKDKRKSRRMLPTGAYTRTFNKVKDNSASQFRTYQLFQEIYDKSRQRREEIKKLKVFSRSQEI
jgi:polyphosphate kinase